MPGCAASFKVEVHLKEEDAVTTTTVSLTLPESGIFRRFHGTLKEKDPPSTTCT